MVHWYFDEMVVMERMREVQREADWAQALGLGQVAPRTHSPGLRARLGRALVKLGSRLQQTEPIRRPDLASPSQCGLR